MANSDSSRSSRGYGATTREFPGITDLLKPKNVFGWSWNFIETWILSRRYSLLLTGVPVLLLVVVGGAFLWYLQGVPDLQLSAKFEAALDAAYANGEAEKARVYSEHLLKLEPDNHPVRFRLMQFLATEDYQADVQQHAIYLSDKDVNYLPAQLWLLTQSLQKDPIIPLNEQQTAATCQKVFLIDPKNGLARRILAQQLMRSGDFKSAEDHLKPILADNPDIGIVLANVQRKLQRNPEVVNKNLKLAQEHFRDLILRNPDNDQARSSFADAARDLGEFDEAELVLQEGLRRNKSQTLRSALARHYAQVAIKRLNASPLNASIARKLTLQAVALDPANSQHLQQALSLQEDGKFYQPADLLPAISHLQQLANPTMADNMTLIRALSAVQNYESAFQTLQPMLTEDQSLRSTQARLLLKLNREDEAQDVINTIQAELTTDSSPLAYLKRAELHGMLNNHRFVRKELEEFRTVVNENNVSISREQLGHWKRLNGISSLALFEEQLAQGQIDDTPENMQLLADALQSRSTASRALDRLAKTAMSNETTSEAANKMLVKLLAAGGNAEVYLLVGTRALESGKIREARGHLEIAHRMDKQNPMVLNNLAIAILRDSNSDESRALDLSEEALSIAPNHPFILTTRAEVLIEMERWDDARQDLELALKTRRNSKEVRRLLVKVCRAMGQPDIADEHQRILDELKST